MEKLTKVRRPRDLLLVFEILCVALLLMFNYEQVDKYIVFLFVGLMSILYISNFILGRVSSGDNYIFLIVSMLLTIGIVTIYRISPKLGLGQLVWSLVGILVFYITYFILRAMRKLEKMTLFYLVVSISLFLITIVFGSEKFGAKNWIQLGSSVTFQPTEITKIVLIFLIAAYYTSYRYQLVNKFNKQIGFLPVAVIYFFVGLLFMQRDLGTATIFLCIFTGIQFIYEEDRKALFFNIGLMLFGALIGYKLFNHVRVRVDIWLNPWTEENIYGKAVQIVQSLFAIGEGGFFGKGLGMGYPNLIPLSYSDLIFPVICEEMGIFTGIGIIMLFMLLAYRAFKIAIAQEYKFYRILAIGIGILFVIQSFLNIGGVIKLIPMTGLTLPFVSYGGSSMISSFIALGVLQVTSEDMSYKYE